MPENDRQRLDIAATVKGLYARDQSLTTVQARSFVRSLQTTWKVATIAWEPADTVEIFRQAASLVHAARIFSTVEGGDIREAAAAYCRAGELYEWLARADDTIARRVPVALLSAGAYQLGGLPAMATGILKQISYKDPGANLFADFLRADFDGVIQKVIDFWAANPELTIRNAGTSFFVGGDGNDMAWLATVELVRSIGLASDSLRRGRPERLSDALKHLRSIESFFVRYAPDDIAFLAFFLRSACERFEQSTIYAPLEHLAALKPEKRSYVRQFARRQYARGRGILWQSQKQGIERLLGNSSFALCTPTGSGKTLVANLAIVKELLLLADGTIASLALYIVPSRALAGEVEAKLAPELGRDFIVTGLYGGVDWGITDAWLTSDSPVVLIATVEKADALMRYLGPVLLARLSLLIVDEAHQVVIENSERDKDDLAKHSSRPLRLESLIARILSLKPTVVRIALTAVAGGAANPVARWIESRDDAEAVGSYYRSTRQAVGSLKIAPNMSPRIAIDILNDRPLAVVGRADNLYVNLVIPVMPRAPAVVRNGLNRHTQTAVLWAALHLIEGDRRILVSLTQSPEDTIRWFSEAFRLKGWESVGRFSPPQDDADAALFSEALEVCVDYCGSESHEVSLLQRGIATNHGQMPQRLRRLMIALIERSICRITVATATLTEGVNLPFDIILLPSLKRTIFNSEKKWREEFPMSTGEFRNLSGRAGRPGATKGMEGITLVVLPTSRSSTAASSRKVQGNQISRLKNDYDALLERLKEEAEGGGTHYSPLAILISSLREKAFHLPGIDSEIDFLNWLDAVAPEDISELAGTANPSARARLADTLDELDSVILATVEEVRSIDNASLSVSETEALLIQFWQKSFARVASAYEAWMSDAFLRRGKAVVETVYSDEDERRRLYSYGYAPHVGRRFESTAVLILSILRDSEGYGDMAEKDRMLLFQRLGDAVADDGGFGFLVRESQTSQDLFSRWSEVLSWWMKLSGATQPPIDDLRAWQMFVTENFEFRLGVAIGAVVASIWTEKKPNPFDTPTLDSWKGVSDLPWFAFWAKELLRWGTLEPFVAFALSQGLARSRPEAEAMRPEFMSWLVLNEGEEASGEATINPQNFLKWARSRLERAVQVHAIRTTKAVLSGADGEGAEYAVVPLRTQDSIMWLDPSGYKLAVTTIPNVFFDSNHSNDFSLVTNSEGVVVNQIF